MSAWVEYETATGRIVRVAGEELTAGEGRAVLVADAAPDPDRAWVTTVDDVLGVHPRPLGPALPEAATGGLTLADLPEGTAVEIVGPLDAAPSVATGTADADGTVTAAIPAPGAYQVRVTPPWPARAVLTRIEVAAGTAPNAASVHLSLPAPLDALKLQAIARIDTDADALARLMVTPGAAMPMIYLRKAEEAAAVLALPVPDDADPAAFPMVAAEAAVDSVSMGAAATTIATSAAVFAAVGSVWDRLRLEAKRDVRAAETVAAIDAAAATVTRAEFEARLTAAGIDPALVLEG